MDPLYSQRNPQQQAQTAPPRAHTQSIIDHKNLSKSCYVLGEEEEEEECEMKEKRPSRQAVNEGLSVDRTPFGELIEHPREGEPYLTDDRSQPQTKGTVNRMCDTILEEKGEDDESHDDHSSV